MDQTLPEELRNLSDADFELIDKIVNLAGESTTGHRTIFQAYNEVIASAQVDPQEVSLYSKLLKLGLIPGGTWGDKWATVKSTRRYAFFFIFLCLD